MAFIEWLRGTRQTADVEQHSSGPVFSISDGDALAEYLGIGTNSLAGVSVTERSALGSTAFYRAVSIVAGTIAGLPLKTYRRLDGDARERVGSWLDRPAGPYPISTFTWKEMQMLHLLIRGETFHKHLFNNAGAIIGTLPIHPAQVDVKWVGSDKKFTVTNNDGSQTEYSTSEMTHVMGLTLDGLRGISPLSVMRNAIGTGLAGEYAAARSFSGALISGIVSPEEDISEDDAKIIKAGLAAKMQGVEHAGDIAVVNRKLHFEPWAMTNEDAQFIESREFQVTEFCRMIGVPPHLVGQTEKQTSWGAGVAEQNLGLARYTLMGWTTRIEEALSDLLPSPRYCEFDYSGLLQGTPQQELELLKLQIDAGILTKDEARAIRNLPPLTEAEKADQQPAAPAAPPTQEKAA